MSLRGRLSFKGGIGSFKVWIDGMARMKGAGNGDFEKGGKVVDRMKNQNCAGWVGGFSGFGVEMLGMCSVVFFGVLYYTILVLSRTQASLSTRALVAI